MEMEKRGGGRGTPRFQRASGSGISPSSTSATWKPRRAGASAGRGDRSSRSSPAGEHDQTGGREDDDSSTPTLIGTCLDMCPEKERAQRERLRDLSVFERLNGNPARTSPSLAVKKFCRTISAKHVQSSDIRPPAVLLITLKYLLSLMDISEHPFEVVHNFLFDRTRSIRQELSMQKVVDDPAIYMYEEMVKFHVISHQKLSRCCSKSEVSSLFYLNKEQLMKCLLSLFELYNNDRRTKSIKKNEAEFYSLYVLLCLGGTIPRMEDTLSVWFCRLPLVIVQSQEMRFARTLLRCLRIGNYRRFFSTIASEACHLQLCLIEPLLNEVRAQAILYINCSGYKLHPYPLAHLAQVLLIKESELELLCHECSLEIIADETGSVLLPAKQTSFSVPKAGFLCYNLLMPEKRERMQISKLES